MRVGKMPYYKHKGRRGQRMPWRPQRKFSRRYRAGAFCTLAGTGMIT